MLLYWGFKKRMELSEFMTVEVLGGGKRERACAEKLSGLGIEARFLRVFVLPIPTARNGVDISGTDIPLSSLLECSEKGALFCSYGAPAVFSEGVKERGGVLADVADDEIFEEENAALTAECTLSYIMQKSRRALSDLKIGIVGYGKIGRRLLELLLFHGADVKVFTRKNSTRVALSELGVSSVLTAEADFSGLDILVNTAPARLFPSSVIRSFDGEILELAPGENFTVAKSLTRLPSLPAKMLPETGGRLYAEAVMRALRRAEVI